MEEEIIFGDIFFMTFISSINIYLLAQGVPAGAAGGPASDKDGCKEVEDAQRPHHVIGQPVIVDCGIVGVDAYEAFHAPYRRDEITETCPPPAHSVAGPCES